jgi:hypothetical protein
MGYVGVKPSAVPLTSADITDGIITSAKIADGSIVNADINASAAIVSTKLSGVANTPAFSAYQSSTQSISNSSHTKIQFQTEDFDSNNNFDSSTNYRFTPTTAGYYLLTACLRCDSGVAEHYLQLYKNGSNHKNFFDLQATNVYAMNGSALVYANGSTDYFEIYFFQNSGTSKTTASGANQTYFSGFRILGV